MRFDYELVLEKAFTSLGFQVSKGGICVPTNRFARFICELGVRDGGFMKLDENTYKLK